VSLRRGPAALAVAAALTLLAACGAQPDAAPVGTADTSASALRGTLTVFAAASLTETFDALAEEFQREHPAVEVVLNYGGSAALAQQIVAGAPVDVFAAASEGTMQVVVDEGLAAADPVVFATNTLELIVPAGNPGGVTGLADLARSELAIALCDPVVPCGAASEQLLQAAGITAAPDTLEEDVKAVVTKVGLAEADAGLVYVTDVRAAGDDVEGIPVPEAGEVEGRYPVAALVDAPSPQAAAAWIALLTGPDGRRALAEAGFGAP
jgi:molybdate transport system substrate-binding protein